MDRPLIDDWAVLLSRPNTSGALLGYYEPDDPEERHVARKRFIAPSNGLTAEGVKLLLEVVLEEPDAVVDESGFVINATTRTPPKPFHVISGMSHCYENRLIEPSPLAGEGMVRCASW